MLLEQFTPDQIAQLRKELALIGNRSKKTELAGAIARIERIFDHDSYGAVNLFPYRAVYDAINVVTDYALDNFAYKTKNNHRGSWGRNDQVPKDIRDEYVQTVNEILDVVEKHKKDRMCPVKPQGDNK